MTIAAAGSIAAAGAIAERNPRRLAARPNASHGLTVCSASAGPDDRRCGSAKMGQLGAKAGRLTDGVKTAVAMTAAAAPISPAFAAAASQEVAQVAADGPLESARLFIAVASVALILFQGPKGDGVVNSLNEKRVFGSASEAKSAVDYVTAGLIGGFIVLSAVCALN